MGKLSWSQLRHRMSRSLALLLGMMVATSAFTVLTAASRTSQLRAIGTVSAHFRTAYDILVRPAGSRTALENQTGTVQPNFLSGIYGGITLRQYHQIAGIPGVQVAAPIAMIGYSMPTGAFENYDLPRGSVAGKGRQLYRVRTTWVSAAGTSRVSQPPSYVYLTPNRLGVTRQTSQQVEVLPDGSRVPVCSSGPGKTANPFGVAAQSESDCYSRIDGLGPGLGTHALPSFDVEWRFPLLIAAIDPAAEAKLDGLNKAVTTGHYLSEGNGPQGLGTAQEVTFPVLAAASNGIGEYAVTRLQKLATPAGPAALNLAEMQRAATAPGRTVLTVRSTSQQAYRTLLAAMSPHAADHPAVFDYRSVGPTRYVRDPDGDLTPVLVHNPLSVWKSGDGNAGVLAAPMDNLDNQYRAITDHEGTAVFSQPVDVQQNPPLPILAGVFDLSRIRAFDPLTRVPLGGYEPTVAAPADAASRAALHGQDLLPTQNVGGYVSQPVQLVTTLGALPALENSTFTNDTHARDPISVIRVRVAGVTGANAVSRERVKEVAQQIALDTNLDVDIVAGSSPAPTTISLPAGRFGQPALRLAENWVRKGVVLAILTAVDKKSVVLFVLILLVCALFVANSATAAVRGRRRELGVLACLGWTRPRLFATVLGELAAIGLTAGLAGALVSVPLARMLGLHVSGGRAALAVPVAMVLAIVAGAVPAWLASRAEPAASVRPQVLAVRRGHQAGSITGLALVNVLRTPGRTLVGVVSLATGVAALTLLTAVTLAFRGVVVGSLLGDAVAVQVRGVDYVAVGATVAMGVLAVADVLFLNIRERAAELAMIRAAGWTEAALSRLVISEGILIGIAGSAAGAVAGLAGAALFAGTLPATLWLAAAAAAAIGTLVTAGAALLPSQLLRRLPTARLLAEE